MDLTTAAESHSAVLFMFGSFHLAQRSSHPSMLWPASEFPSFFKKAEATDSWRRESLLSLPHQHADTHVHTDTPYTGLCSGRAGLDQRGNIYKRSRAGRREPDRSPALPDSQFSQERRARLPGSDKNCDGEAPRTRRAQKMTILGHQGRLPRGDGNLTRLEGGVGASCAEGRGTAWAEGGTRSWGALEVGGGSVGKGWGLCLNGDLPLL